MRLYTYTKNAVIDTNNSKEMIPQNLRFKKSALTQFKTQLKYKVNT